ncbi:MAG: DUF3157 family protein [Flaviramulus sp.]|nr:DUF3157 family protein [Flaviramulus sp.]NNC49014.1 DUF3157 family protein [Flaviramulus sp.]
MKASCFVLLFVITSLCFAQNTQIVKTDDGKRVLLNDNFTWEYIDKESDTTSILIAEDGVDCNVADDFEEPALNRKIQDQLKKGRATINDVKKKVAKDYNCTIDDVLLLSFSEQKTKAVYKFCANGIRVIYKRVGHSIIKSRKLF